MADGGADHAALTERVHNLERALEHRGVIERAKGILMAREGCSADDAFDILRRASQRENRKLYDIASDLVMRFESHRGNGNGSTPKHP